MTRSGSCGPAASGGPCRTRAPSPAGASGISRARTPRHAAGSDVRACHHVSAGNSAELPGLALPSHVICFRYRTTRREIAGRLPLEGTLLAWRGSSPAALSKVRPDGSQAPKDPCGPRRPRTGRRPSRPRSAALAAHAQTPMPARRPRQDPPDPAPTCGRCAGRSAGTRQAGPPAACAAARA